MPAVCSFACGLYAHDPQHSQVAPWQTPELPVSHEPSLDAAAGALSLSHWVPSSGKAGRALCLFPLSSTYF